MNLQPVADYLPHAGPMILLDHVLSVAPDELTAEVTIRADSMFADSEGVPAWVGLEYMAQTVAALAGWEARQAGKPVRPGFLLGTRDLRAHVPAFATGTRLCVHAHRLYVADNGITAMACQIRSGDSLLAEATLTVFQPDDTQAFLAQA